MTITVLLKSLIIFAVILCYCQSCAGTVDCEKDPYNPACRGSQTRKRLVPLPVMRAVNCDEADCRLSGLPRMKFLIAILDDTPFYRSEGRYSNDVNSNLIHLRKNRLRNSEDSKDVYMDDY